MEYWVFLGVLGGILAVVIGISIVIYAKMRKSKEEKAKRFAIALAEHFGVNGKDEKYNKDLDKLRTALRGMPDEKLSTLSDIKSFYDKESKKEITGNAIKLLSSAAVYVLLERKLKKNDNNMPPFIFPA